MGVQNVLRGRLTSKRKRMANEQSFEQLSKEWQDADPKTQMEMASELLGVKLVSANQKTPGQQMHKLLTENRACMECLIQARKRENEARFENAS